MSETLQTELMDFNEFLKGEWNMKFDAIVANFPFQTKSDEKNEKTQAIWHKFVEKSVEICKEDGFIAAIHPSGWRSSGKIFEEAKKVLRNKQIKYLEIHDEADGLKTFKATTRYDWYILKNEPINSHTNIVDKNGKLCEVMLSDLTCIPNCMIEKVVSMIAKGKEKPVEILHSFSAYESRKDWISQEKSNVFKYPIVYSTPIEKPTIWWSSTNRNGHFGVSKIILNPCRPIGYVIDANGEYGMSQFCVGIVGDQKYLDMVASVLKNQKTNGFAEFMESCHFTDKIFNKDIIGTFRKDFWKEFLDENGNEI
jgi:hypothetical protein